MKRGITLSFLLLFVLFVSGCSSNTYSDSFIIDSEMIDEISVGVVAREGDLYKNDVFKEGEVYNIEIRSEPQIREMLNLLSNIKLKKLSSSETQEIFGNQEVWAQKVNYIIILVASNEHQRGNSNAAIKGTIYVLGEGNLIFVDPKATEGPYQQVVQTNKSFFYISKEKQKEIFNEIVSIIEEGKDTF
jgi:hypothetical protein